jgi:divalent metal cation (Fe/Co/Zn/Cd) transporter
MTVSVGGLMDEAVPKDVLRQIERTILAQSHGAVEAHDLKTRNAGRAIFIEFHLVVPAKMTVFDAHAICDRIEQVLLDEIEGSQVTIHIEPDDKAKHVGAEVLRID